MHTLKAAKAFAIDAILRQLFRSKSVRRTALQQLFSRHLDRRALALAQFEDHALIVDPRDHMIAFQLLSGKRWQFEDFKNAVAILRRYGALRPGTVFADIGANIGTQTAYALLSNEFSSAIALEPEPSNFALLSRNMEFNGLTHRIRLIQKAAGGAPGTGTLRVDRSNFGAHTISLCRSSDRSIPVELVRFDDLAQNLDLGLIWVDVEGYEVEALRGMPEILKRGIPICVECSSRSVTLEILRPYYRMVSYVAELKAGGSPVSIDEFSQDRAMRDVLFFNPAN